MPAWMSQIDAYAGVAALANVVLAALGAVVSIYEKWVRRHRPLILIGFVVCGCIGAVAAIISAAKSARDLQEANSAVSKAVEQTRKEVLATVNGVVNGGDSFCYVVPDPLVPAKPGMMNLMVIHHGKYPLHDVSMFFYDWRKAMSSEMPQIVARGSTPLDMQKLHAETLEIASKKIAVPPLLPNHYGQISFDYQPLSRDDHEYSFDFTGPNGEWKEVIRLQLVHGKWVHAFRVTREVRDPKDFFSKYEELVKDVDPAFPQPLDWNKSM